MEINLHLPIDLASHHLITMARRVCFRRIWRREEVIVFHITLNKLLSMKDKQGEFQDLANITIKQIEMTSKESAIVSEANLQIHSTCIKMY